MRSSGSTPSRSEGPIRLHLWIVGEDHPRACTGRRLVERGEVDRITSASSFPSGIVLDPHAPHVVGRWDEATARARGVGAVDCSWNQLGRRGGYPEGPVAAVPARRRRRLPLLLAGNAQHYGRLGELNTVEALAAALIVLGEPDHGAQLLEGFHDGASFLSLNREPLAAYAEAATEEAAREAEVAFFGPGG